MRIHTLPVDEAQAVVERRQNLVEIHGPCDTVEIGERIAIHDGSHVIGRALVRYFIQDEGGPWRAFLERARIIDPIAHAGHYSMTEDRLHASVEHLVMGRRKA